MEKSIGGFYGREIRLARVGRPRCLHHRRLVAGNLRVSGCTKMSIFWEPECGDGLAAIKTLPQGLVDAVITDPPYGIKVKKHSLSTRTDVEWRGIANDDGSLDLSEMLRMPTTVVCFGGENYPHQLPHRGRWICWDKRVNENCDRMLGSSFELAWTNKTSGKYRFYRVMHGGVVNADGHNIKRVHPTQKPIILMQRIIEDFTKPGDVVLDPFCGSGTTGIAALRAGRSFLGFEIDPVYAEIARNRIAQAASELGL